MSETSLTRIEPMETVRRMPVRNDALDLISRALDNPNIDVGKLKEMLDLRDRVNAENAKNAYNDAMAAFQAECPVIVKTKTVPDRNGRAAYAYAPIETIVHEIKPLLQKHGFHYTLDTDTDSKDGWVIARCKITHRDGHSTESTAKFPLGVKTGIMSETQNYAAALTFASRRVLCNAFGIVTAGEDMDGRKDAPKASGPSSLQGDKPASASEVALKKKLVDLTRDAHGIVGYALTEEDRSNITQYLIDECILSDTEDIKDLTGARLAEVIAKLEEKR